MNRQRRELSAAPFLGCTAVAILMTLGLIAPAQAVVVSDNFDTAHDYQFGAVPAGGIWTNVENVLNLSGGAMNASTSNAGTLTVEDNGTFDADGDPGNGISGMGWEGGRSTAPFLHAPVPAGQDFTATVKISAQTSGTWSAAGLVARAANSPTPPGIGADHADENFVTMTSFRTDAANTAEGNTLMKRIEAGAQVSDVNILVNNATEPLPILLRLERVGGGTAYRGWVSTDGGATYQFQSRVIPTAGNALSDPAVGLEVGLSYHNFGTLAGTAQFDDFVLDTYDPLPAPGAPTISTAQLAYTVSKGGVLVSSLFDATGTDPLSWIRTPNLAGTDAMLPGAQGGAPSPLVPVPPDNGSYFRWAVPATQANGIYLVTVTAMNDWGQTSNPVILEITVIPEPSSLAMALLIGIGTYVLRRRRP